MKTKHIVAAVVAIVLIPIFCFFALAIGVFFYTEGFFGRYDLTTEQQAEIARTLGFDLAPDETLTVKYYAGFWPKTIDSMWVEINGISSEEEFLARCHEKTAFSWEYRVGSWPEYERFYYAECYTGYISEDYEIAKVQGMINNRWEPYIVHCIIWGGLVAEMALIITLIVKIAKHRKTKKESPTARMEGGCT